MFRVCLVALVGRLVASLVQAAPQIDAIAPQQGPIAGGTEIVVTGSGFAGATVRLDSTTITPLSQTDAEIHLRMPAHDNGYAVVNVRSGTSNAYAEFLYVPPRLEDLPAGYITTIAGMGNYARDFGPATNATITPTGLAYDGSGNLYIAEDLNNKVSRVRPDGQIERVTAPYPGTRTTSSGIPSTDAVVLFPKSVCSDGAGNVYVPDAEGWVWRIDAQGVINAIAGTGQRGSSGDGGPALQAKVGSVRHIAADAADVFFLEYPDGSVGRHRIRRIHLADGKIFHVAGTDTPGFSGDGGPAAQAQINTHDDDRGHLALDAAGNLFLADAGNHRIRRIDRATGIITTFYTLPAEQVAINPDAAAATIWALTIDRLGNVYYGGNTYNATGAIVKLSPAGQVLKTWGANAPAIPVDGAPASAGFGGVIGLAINSAGNVVFTDDWVKRVFRIDAITERLSTVAGTGPLVVGDTGPAIATTLDANDIVFDRDGSLLVADGASLRIRRIDRTGRISTFAGNGTQVRPQPLPAPAIDALAFAMSIKLDANGEYDLAAGGSAVLHIDRAGIMSQLTRESGGGFSGDGGPARNAEVRQPWDTVRDAAGNLLIADSNNNRIRRIDARTGIITTIVGSGPVNGAGATGQSSGDGGLAIKARINTPLGIALDSAGNLFISESNNIRKVDPSGRISTFASSLNGVPSKLIFDRAGNLYAAPRTGIVRIDPAGNQTWIVGGSTDASVGFAGDGGPATQAKVNFLFNSYGLAIDYDGNLFFCDNRRIRAVRLALPASPPVIFAQPANQAVTAGATATLTFPANGASPLRYQWQNNGAVVADSTRGTLTLANFASANTGIYTCTLVNGVGAKATSPFIVGLDTTSKVVGAGQIAGGNITHPNGNIFDQVLVTGPAETITADPAKVTRTSYIDLSDDIVQVEFSGAGTLSLVLDGASGPAAPVNYNQPSVSYMKGHAGIVITGANETTNVSIFTVGRVTAFDPTGRYNILLPPSATNDPANNGSSLFTNHATTNYDGIADLAFIAIASPNGKFGGLRAANASFWSTRGYTGIYAPGVQFSGPVNIENIDAQSDATPVFQIGGADGGTRITGGDLKQDNNRAVQVSGLTKLLFVAGATSANRSLPAQMNRGRFEENGVDVTVRIVVNP